MYCYAILTRTHRIAIFYRYYLPKRASATMGQKRMSHEERRQQIIAVATELFASKGFRGATTRSIAEAAGVSEAIIFRHFATKEDLYDAIITSSLEKRNENWNRDALIADSKGEELDGLLLRIGRAIVERHRKDPTFIRLMMYSSLEDHKFRQRFFETQRSPFIKIIRQRITEGVDSGNLTPIDPGLTARSFHRTLLQYCISNFVSSHTPPDPGKDEAFLQNLVKVYVGGINARQATPETFTA